MSEHTPLTEEEREIRRLLPDLLVAEYGEDRANWTELGSVNRIAKALAARTSTATADTGLRERVEAELDLAEQSERHVADDEVLVEVAVIRAALDATASPTTDTGARDE